jgi:uncharacterized protein (DUF2249 family)
MTSKSKEMKINSHTRIKVLLDADRDNVIDSLIRLNSNFSKLRNPVLRKFLAGRVTIADACKIAGCGVDNFLDNMKQLGFSIAELNPESIVTKADTIDFNSQRTVLELDVRPYLEQNRDPLAEILKLANQLGAGERIKIINSFEPTPLISLLGDKGFLHHTDVADAKTVITWFEKTGNEIAPVELPAELDQSDEQHVFDRVLQRFPPEKIRYIDVRNLEMPQPMMQILENIENLDADELLYVYHKKVPVYLLPELSKRGLVFLINHKSTAELHILIYRL